MSRWSISAMSPRTRCLTSCLVRRPGRTEPLQGRGPRPRAASVPGLADCRYPEGWVASRPSLPRVTLGEA